MSNDTPINEALTDKLIKEQLPKIERLAKQAELIVKSTMSHNDKAEAFLSLSQNLSDTITPYTPCTKQCSHCCNMSVTVNTWEAEMISRFTGRVMETRGLDPITLSLQEDPVKKYAGVPCTFLVEGKCSIYPVRPVPCRTHHNLAVDEKNCMVGVGPLENWPTTPAINLEEFKLWHSLSTLDAGWGIEDIRAYFPAK